MTLERAGVIAVDIYNVSGIRVKTITGNFDSGKHSIEWDGQSMNGSAVDQGLYIYKAYANGKMKTGRLIKIAN